MKNNLLYIFVLLSPLLFVGSCKVDNNTDDGQQSVDCVNTASPDTLTLSANQVKGWEVYSWPACGDWNFSLLYGTNALKNYDEVTGRQASSRFVIRVWGKNKLKALLNRIPAGESLSLIGENWLSRTWGAGSFGTLQLPPSSILSEIQQSAAQANLDFHIAN